MLSSILQEKKLAAVGLNSEVSETLGEDSTVSEEDSTTSEIDIDYAKKIIVRWYEAADVNLNTTDRMALFKDTNELILELRAVEKAGNPEKIAQIANEIVQEFDNHNLDDAQKLAKWIAQNSLETIDGFEGAYPTLHDFFKTVAEMAGNNTFYQTFEVHPFTQILGKIGGVFSSRFFSTPPPDTKLLTFKLINLEALKQMRESKGNFAGLTDDLKKLIIRESLQLGSKNMKAISREGNQLTGLELTKRFLQGEVNLEDSGVRSFLALQEFFGGAQNCKAMRKLPFIPYTFLFYPNSLNLNPDEIQKLSEIFPNLESISFVVPDNFEFVTHMSLQNFKWDTDLGVLSRIPNLIELDLTGCNKITNFNPISQQTNLKRLILNGCIYFKDLSILKSLSLLYYLEIKGCYNIDDFSPLQSLSLLEMLDVSASSDGAGCVTDANSADFFASLPKLRFLGLSNYLSPIAFMGLEKLTELENLKLSNSTGFKDFDKLEKLTHLVSLDLTKCQIADFKFLIELPSLTDLAFERDLPQDVEKSLRTKEVSIIR